jgi:hypothetical protein
MSGINTDVDDYTLEDLYTILNLKETASEFQIKDATNDLIARMKTENKPELVKFFEDVKNKILDSLANSENEPDEIPTPKVSDWYENQYLEQKNPIQSNKLTDRKQTVEIFDDNTHYQMKQNKIGISNTFQVPIAQGTINPTLRNTTTRMVCIDSQYRQNILPFANDDINATSFNTDFTLDLSDPLSNVISIKLYSIHIPTTWYALDTTLGNTCFKIGATIYTIPSGNYTQATLASVITNLTPSSVLTLSFDPATNKARFQATTALSITFYTDNGFDVSGCKSCVGGNIYSNQNLGWTLGFRREPDANGNISMTVPASPLFLTSDVPADLYGPKYCMLVIDDYNQNHLNKGLVQMTDVNNKLSLPSYYNFDIPLSCSAPTQQQQATKSAPRQLTEAQLYSLNEILKSRNSKKTRSYGPTTTDVLAVIPFSGITTLRATQQPLIESGLALQTNIRTYFGPVSIERLRVKLIDDKGNLMNLHDNDWSFTLIVEQLYQY